MTIEPLPPSVAELKQLQYDYHQAIVPIIRCIAEVMSLGRQRLTLQDGIVVKSETIFEPWQEELLEKYRALIRDIQNSPPFNKYFPKEQP